MRHLFFIFRIDQRRSLSVRSAFTADRGVKRLFRPFCLLSVAVMREFFDVVHEAVELPLRVDFLLAA